MAAKKESSENTYPLLGFEPDGQEIRGFHLQDNFEEHLLLFKTSRWQKFKAKYFKPVCLGIFKKAGHTGYMGWFLFWCNQCQKFTVNYKRGFDERLDCESCLSKSYP